jgi:phage-related tail fiber protein
MSIINIGRDPSNRVVLDGTNNQINNVIRANGIFPTGGIIFCAYNSIPKGYLKANGASLSTTTYPDLFAAIGYIYGGSGESFNIPDLRGEFIRSLDDGRGAYDSGRSIGSFQDHDWKSLWITEVGGGWNSGYTHGPTNSGKGIYGINGWSGAQFTGQYANPSAAQGYLWGSEDIHSRNRALLACIKY